MEVSQGATWWNGEHRLVNCVKLNKRSELQPCFNSGTLYATTSVHVRELRRLDTSAHDFEISIGQAETFGRGERNNAS